MSELDDVAKMITRMQRQMVLSLPVEMRRRLVEGLRDQIAVIEESLADEPEGLAELEAGE